MTSSAAAGEAATTDGTSNPVVEDKTMSEDRAIRERNAAPPIPEDRAIRERNAAPPIPEDRAISGAELSETLLRRASGFASSSKAEPVVDEEHSVAGQRRQNLIRNKSSSKAEPTLDEEHSLALQRRQNLMRNQSSSTAEASSAAWQRRQNLPRNDGLDTALRGSQRLLETLPPISAELSPASSRRLGNGIVGAAESAASDSAMEAAIAGVPAMPPLPFSVVGEDQALVPVSTLPPSGPSKLNDSTAEPVVDDEHSAAWQRRQNLMRNQSSSADVAKRSASDEQQTTPGVNNNNIPSSSTQRECNDMQSAKVAPHTPATLPSSSKYLAGTISGDRVWPKLEAVRDEGPDALERLRTECTNYAVVTALLAGTAMDAFINPPEFDRSWQMYAYGATSGVSVVMLLANVILSTIIIIHTNMCCKAEHKEVYLRIVDDLTGPNTACFYVAVFATPVWMCLAAIPTYGYGVAFPVCGSGLLLFCFLCRIFTKHKSAINSMTSDSYAAQQSQLVSTETTTND